MLVVKLYPSNGGRFTDESDVVIELPDGRVGVVRVDRISNGGVRVGFEFPKDITIVRSKFACEAGRAAIKRINERVSCKRKKVMI